MSSPNNRSSKNIGISSQTTNREDCTVMDVKSPNAEGTDASADLLDVLYFVSVREDQIVKIH